MVMLLSEFIRMVAVSMLTRALFLRIDIPAEVGENAGLEEGNTSSATGGR